MTERWPALPYLAWKDTCTTLHLWTQIVGKIRFAQTPWMNHSWHVPLYVTATGLTTSPIPHATCTFQIDFDFRDHVLRLLTSAGQDRQIALKPQTVADFHAALFSELNGLGIDVTIDNRPNEIPDAIPFPDDDVHRAYDADAARRFWRILLATHHVLTHFRSGFLGKASPVHFFWGSFDLAVTRFSGRRAPRHAGGVPNLPDDVAREAYSHEVSSAGFWPGGGGVIEEPAFYSYAYPPPEGFADARVKPAAAYFNTQLGEFVLPYEAVRTAPDPAAALMDFLQSTYEAAADLAMWDRASLDCARGVPRKPRPV